MFENITKLFKKIGKKENGTSANSKNAAKERLHLVLMQDRANVSADFLELMKQEIIDVIKKYIDVDESAIDVRLTNKENEDGTNGAPALYANIPILNIKNEARKVDNKEEPTDNSKADKIENKDDNEEAKQDEVVEENNQEVKDETEIVADEEIENALDEANEVEENQEEKEASSEEEKQARAEKIIEEVVEKLETINEGAKEEN